MRLTGRPTICQNIELTTDNYSRVGSQFILSKKMHMSVPLVEEIATWYKLETNPIPLAHEAPPLCYSGLGLFLSPTLTQHHYHKHKKRMKDNSQRSLKVLCRSCKECWALADEQLVPDAAKVKGTGYRLFTIVPPDINKGSIKYYTVRWDPHFRMHWLQLKWTVISICNTISEQIVLPRESIEPLAYLVHHNNQRKTKP